MSTLQTQTFAFACLAGQPNHEMSARRFTVQARTLAEALPVAEQQVQDGETLLSVNGCSPEVIRRKPSAADRANCIID